MHMTVADLKKHLEGIEGDRIIYLSVSEVEDVVDAEHLDVGEWKGQPFIVLGDAKTTPCTHEVRLF